MAVAAGDEHTCAQLALDDDILCWGSNAEGQLDLVTNAGSDQRGPALLLGQGGLAGVGPTYTCAVGLACWGDTPLGSFAMPQSVLFPSNPQVIFAGAFHACAIGDTASRQIWCWGDDSYGQLGGGADGGALNLPVPVPGLTNVTAFAAGRTHNCAISAGVLKCWGRFDASGTTPFDARVPTNVIGLANQTVLASGDGVSCVSNASTVLCFGKLPQLLNFYDVPATALCVGSGYGCALETDAGVVCWGDNSHGQLGSPSAGSSSSVPVRAELDAGAKAITCGRAHVCALGLKGEVWCWGEGAHYKLGNTTTTDQFRPVRIAD